MNVFAPKAKASRKVNTSAASTTSSKTSNKSLDFNAVKDYRKSETKKKRKQESPPTDSSNDKEELRKPTKRTYDRVKSLKDNIVDITPESSFNASDNNDLTHYNLRMHRQKEQYENKKKEAEERDKPQRNRFNWMLDDIGDDSRKNSSDLNERDIEEPFEYRLSDTGSASPPSMDDAIYNIPSTSKDKGIHRIPSKESGKASSKKDKPQLQMRLGSPMSKYCRNKEKEQHNAKEKAKQKEIAELRERYRENENSKRSAKDKDKETNNNYHTRIHISNSANFDDDDVESREISQQRHQTKQRIESDTDSDGVQVTNPISRKKKSPRQDHKQPERADILGSYIKAQAKGQYDERPPEKAHNSANTEKVTDNIADTIEKPYKGTSINISDEDSSRKLIDKPKGKPRARPRAIVREPAADQSSLKSYFKPTIKAPTNNLCPVCDQVLPQFKSQHFKAVLKEFLNVAKVSPRSSNAFGMRAHVLAETELCTAHKLDTKIIPEGRKKGYPFEHDWNELSDRILKLSKSIRTIVKTKENSKFWQKAKEEYLKRGSKRAKGLDAQFEHFEDEQPGYYGEIGLMVILFNLNLMVSNKSKKKIKITDESVHPLTSNDFMRRILVPEVANLLISQDRAISIEKAEEIRKDSREYGNALFSSDNKDINWRPPILEDSE
ncbi:hypothetical protein E3Q19_00606 [Wallemia mellicola]|nr:hypothetical protein E3Q19_00606 [Wallemia mellicola]TIC75726.1 hypothetical protein E3Q00_00599 [Wallemia mellicola]